MRHGHADASNSRHPRRVPACGRRRALPPLMNWLGSPLASPIIDAPAAISRHRCTSCPCSHVKNPSTLQHPTCRPAERSTFCEQRPRGQKAWRARGASRQSSDPHSPSDPRVRLSPAARPYPEAQFAKQDLTSTSPQPTVEFIPVPFRWLALTAGSNRAVLPRRVGTARSFDSKCSRQTTRDVGQIRMHNGSPHHKAVW